MVIFTLVAVVFAAGFSGCEKRIEVANIDAVNRMQDAAAKNMRGLTPKEVESVMGQPQAIEKVTFKRPVTEIREIPGERHIYKQDGREIVLHFVNGKLEDSVSHFGAKEPSSPDEAKAPNSGAKMPPMKN